MEGYSVLSVVMRQRDFTSPASVADASHSARTAIGKYGGGLGGGLKDIATCDLSAAVVGESRASVAPSARSRVFVIDDDESVADVVSQVLRHAGFQVTTFYDALAALRHALESKPDVVVTDYSMPNMNGLEVAAWLRENCPDCKIVIISGIAAEVAERADSNLEFTLLQKPIDRRALISAMQ